MTPVLERTPDDQDGWDEGGGLREADWGWRKEGEVVGDLLGSEPVDDGQVVQVCDDLHDRQLNLDVQSCLDLARLERGLR